MVSGNNSKFIQLVSIIFRFADRDGLICIQILCEIFIQRNKESGTIIFSFVVS